MTELFFIVAILLGVNRDITITPDIVETHLSQSTKELTEYLNKKSKEDSYGFKVYKITCNKNKCVMQNDYYYSTPYFK